VLPEVGKEGVEHLGGELVTAAHRATRIIRQPAAPLVSHGLTHPFGVTGNDTYFVPFISPS